MLAARCFLLWLSLGEVFAMEELLKRVLIRSQVTEDIMSSFLQRAISVMTGRHLHVVLLVRDLEFDVSVVPKTTTARLVHTSRRLKKQKYASGVTVIVGTNSVEDVLQHIGWTASTKFFVILPRRFYNNELYIESLSHQSSDLHGNVVTKSELLEDFAEFLPKQDNSAGTARTRQFTKQILHEFWMQRVVNVVVMQPQKTNVYMYSFFPYTTRNCGDHVIPLLINAYFSNLNLFYKQPKLFPMKTHAMHGCPLKVSLVQNPPGVITNGNQLEGIEYDLLNAVFKEMNATAHVRVIQNSDGNSSTTAMDYVLSDLSEGDSDFGAGLLIPTFPHSDIAEDINFSLTVCLAWVVPNRVHFDGYLGFIARVFDPYLWGLTAATIVTSGLVLFTLLHVSNHKEPRLLEVALFKVVTVSVAKNTIFPKKSSAQLFLISYVWFSIIMGTAFQARLGSQNIAPVEPEQLETTEDIVESGAEITAFKSIAHLFKHQIQLTRKNGEVVNVVPMDLPDALRKISRDKRTAYIGLRIAVKYASTVMYREQFYIYIHTNCIVQYHTFLALRRKSPFMESVNQIMVSLVEAGFKERYLNKYLHRMEKPKIWQRRRRGSNDGVALDQSIAMGGVRLWCLGIAISLVAFLFEMLRPIVKGRTCRRY